jgi:hypothetical protein
VDEASHDENEVDTKLVLTRKSQECVVVGGSKGFECVLKGLISRSGISILLVHPDSLRGLERLGHAARGR